MLEIVMSFEPEDAEWRQKTQPEFSSCLIGNTVPDPLVTSKLLTAAWCHRRARLHVTEAVYTAPLVHRPFLSVLNRGLPLAFTLYFLTSAWVWFVQDIFLQQGLSWWFWIAIPRHIKLSSQRSIRIIVVAQRWAMYFGLSRSVLRVKNADSGMRRW